MFAFAFNGENRYIGYIKPKPVEIEGPFTLGSTTVTPLPVEHGKVTTIGFLFVPANGKRIAYISDCKRLHPEAEALVQDVDVLVVDALRFREHPTHLNFDEALALREAVGARQTWFTHFSCEVDHEKAQAALPKGVALAYDGLKLDL